MKPEEAMREAIKEAEKAKHEGEIPVGAVVVFDGKIIARAHNEREALCDPTAHAEVLALRRAASNLRRRRLSGCTLYVTLEPCPMCAGAVLMSEPDGLVFGAFDRKAGCAGSVYALAEDPAFMHAVPCSGGLLEVECKKMIEGFFEDKRS